MKHLLLERNFSFKGKIIQHHYCINLIFFFCIYSRWNITESIFWTLDKNTNHTTYDNNNNNDDDDNNWFQLKYSVNIRDNPTM